MSDNVALVMRSFEAMRAWDVDALLQLYHPDVAFLPLTGTRVKSGGYRGHDGVRAYMSEARDLWDVLQSVGEVFTEVGDHVLVTGRCRVRGRASGAESNPACAWWWAFATARSSPTGRARATTRRCARQGV